MGITFEDYDLGFKYVSLALSENARDELLGRGLNVLYAERESLLLCPEMVKLSANRESIEQILCHKSFDVFSIWENGSLHLEYDDASNDNYLFVTGRCNSNCIMCPSPEWARMHSPMANIDDKIEFIRYIPSDLGHLTITGGEPFLAGEELFKLLRILRDGFKATEFLFLTNGRIFALEKYANLLLETKPLNMLMAIPLHGSCATLHDQITRTSGSFDQTVCGIENLLARGVPIELRLVVSRLNASDFSHMTDFILAKFKGIMYVSIIAMEMTGTARANRDAVWIPYGEAFRAVRVSIQKLLMGGIDVKLYNFPLCTVDRGYWTLCEKSIAPSKVQFDNKCQSCSYRKACGGVFAGTLGLVRDELEPQS